MKLKAFIGAARLYWKTYVAAAAVVFGLGLAWLLLTPAKFVSTTQLMVSINGSTTAAAYQNADVVAERVNSYVALLTSDVVSQRVIDKLGLSMTAPELAANVSATNVPPKTAIIDIAVSDTSPERAQLLAETFATEFISYTRALETPTGEDGQKVRVTEVSAASQPSERRAERVVLGVLAAVAATLLGAVAVWIRSLTDPVIRTDDRAAEAAGVPVLGSVSAGTAASSGDLESYRRLRAVLKSIIGRDDGRVLEIASTDIDVDATDVASNLGRALQLSGHRCIVLDVCRTESPSNSQPDDRPVDGRITNTDDGENTVIEAGHGQVEWPDILTMSTWAADPDLIATRAAAESIDRLRADFNTVIIAAPPVLSTITASALSEYADGVLLLSSSKTTKRLGLSRAAASLKATGAQLTGVVLVHRTKEDVELVDISERDAARADP